MIRTIPAARMLRDYTEAFFHRHDAGQGVVEYSLIVGTISIVIVAAFLTTGIATSVQNLAQAITDAITNHDSTGL